MSPARINIIRSQSMKIGDRARFIGKDTQFHNGEREGKVGTIVLDANLDSLPVLEDFSGGTCGWQIDGDPGVFVTALEDLTLEEKPER